MIHSFEGYEYLQKQVFKFLKYTSTIESTLTSKLLTHIFFSLMCSGVNDSTDNCPFDVNADQLDSEDVVDGIGDVCDPDDDNDGKSSAKHGFYIL